MSTNHNSKPFLKRFTLKGLRSIFSKRRISSSVHAQDNPSSASLPDLPLGGHRSSHVDVTLSNVSLNQVSSMPGFMDTAPASMPPSAVLLTTGNDLGPRTTAEDNLSLTPANQAADAGKSLATWSTASDNINYVTAQSLTANPLTNLLNAQVNTGISTATEAHMDPPQLASSLIGTDPTATHPSAVPFIVEGHTTSGITVHVGTPQHGNPLTSANEEGPVGNGIDRPAGGSSDSVTVPQAPPSTAHDSNKMIKNGLRTTLNGVELLLKKVEKLLSGTPFQVPAVSDNNDNLQAQITRTRDRLNAVKDANEKTTDMEDLMKDFAGKLNDILGQLSDLANKPRWKKVLENEKDKSQIDNIFKNIDEQTKDFQ
ncbi:hypothetical protein C0995_007380, partial [Termitomyces sp. Mi166